MLIVNEPGNAGWLVLKSRAGRVITCCSSWFGADDHDDHVIVQDVQVRNPVERDDKRF